MPFRKMVVGTHWKDGLPLSTPWSYDEKQLPAILQGTHCLHHLDLRMEFKEHRVLSRLPHLVRLNCTSLFSLLVRFVWAGENAAIALGCAPKADQTSVPRPPWRGGLGTLSNEPWSGLFVVRTRSDLKQTQLQRTNLGLWGGAENQPAQLSLHNSSVLSAAFYSCLCLLPRDGVPLEFSRTLFLTNRKAV